MLVARSLILALAPTSSLPTSITSPLIHQLGKGSGMLGFEAAVADRFVDDATAELKAKCVCVCPLASTEPCPI